MLSPSIDMKGVTIVGPWWFYCTAELLLQQCSFTQCFLQKHHSLFPYLIKQKSYKTIQEEVQLQN